MLRRLTFQMGAVLIGMSVCGVSADAATLVIDEFTIDQPAISSDVPGGESLGNRQTDAGALGGERRVDVFEFSKAVDGLGASVTLSGGLLEVATDGAALGVASIVWDPSGGVDLTGAGMNDRLVLDGLTTNGVTGVALEVFGTNGAISRFEYVFPAAGTTFLEILFSDLSPQTTASPDLTQVDAVQLFFNADGSNSGALSLDGFVASDASFAAIPLPASGLLFLSSLMGLLFMGRSRRV